MSDIDEALLSLPDAAAWDAWLAEHDDKPGPVWLRVTRKSAEVPAPTWDEAVDVALCHGWIDSQARSLDGTSYRQRFTPRRARSPWSAINVARVERLLAEGRMRERGLAEVRAAQEDGRWEHAYPSQRSAGIPDELQDALRDRPAATQRLEALGRGERYLLLLPLYRAYTAPSRARQVERVLVKLEEPDQTE